MVHKQAWSIKNYRYIWDVSVIVRKRKLHSEVSTCSGCCAERTQTAQHVVVVWGQSNYTWRIYGQQGGMYHFPHILCCYSIWHYWDPHIKVVSNRLVVNSYFKIDQPFLQMKSLYLDRVNRTNMNNSNCPHSPTEQYLPTCSLQKCISRQLRTTGIPPLRCHVMQHLNTKLS
jgi:hypothetical protein